MSQFPKARFLTSAADLAGLLPDDGAEVAFVGRSNAGKSSAINTIVNRRQFARVSKTPGRTQLINFFELEPGRRLVDLPGYGFAKVADSVRARWSDLIGGYLADRQSLRGLVLIVDVRRGLGEGDRLVRALGLSYGLTMHVLLSKADKLKRGQATRTLAAVRNELGPETSVQLYSSIKRTGVDEARARLRSMLEGSE